MESSKQETLTLLLKRAEKGQAEASNELFSLVYEELKVLAHAQFKGMSHPETMHTTALVHEAYLKLFDQDELNLENRVHFFALSAKVMRQILVDYYRKQSAKKRGGPGRNETLNEERIAGNKPSEELLDLDFALTKLEKLNERLATVVECKFFAAMKEEEIALFLGVTDRTVRNDWQKARMFLSKQLAAGHNP